MSRAARPSDYAVLGLRPGAGDTEIRDAYRRLAKLLHPDRNPGDTVARSRFERVTESYAALRHSPTRPASAAAAGAPRAAGHRGGVTIADLPPGTALWVSPAAVVVAPDRNARLVPGAAGTAHPNATNTIRIHRRADGYHVFMPPQPTTRWGLSAAAETMGLDISELWVGDRQEDHHSSSPRMPRRLLSRTIAEMQPASTGWTATAALHSGADGRWFLDGTEPLASEPHPATPVRVRRDGGGYWVYAEIPAADWPMSAPVGGATPVAVAGGLLGGAAIGRYEVSAPA